MLVQGSRRDYYTPGTLTGSRSDRRFVCKGT